MNLSSKVNGTIQLTFSFVIEAVELLVDHCPKDLIKELYDAVVIDVNNFAHTYTVNNAAATTTFTTADGMSGTNQVSMSNSSSTSAATPVAASVPGGGVSVEPFNISVHFTSMTSFTRLETVSKCLGVSITSK